MELLTTVVRSIGQMVVPSIDQNLPKQCAQQSHLQQQIISANKPSVFFVEVNLTFQEQPPLFEVRAMGRFL